MTFWLLDDGPFGVLSRFVDHSWQWPASTLHIMREVAQGAPYDKTGRRQRLMELRDASGLAGIQIHDGDDRAGAVLYGHLRPSGAAASKDIGEDASIAFCIAQEPNAIFVTMDKRSAYVALAELGPGRVATPFDVWIWLENNSLITCSQRDDLMRATAKGDQGIQGIPVRYQK